jgi:beta-lactamase superfamily II metal-dependent hydrolase
VSSQPLETKPKPTQSTSEKAALWLDMHVLHCGQGDTILLRLPRDQWILIDCNLPRGAVRSAFFQLITSYKINRLEVICLTHPHDDHYTGMEEVLRYFNSDGRSVGVFCDCGTEPKEIHMLLNRNHKSIANEYFRLYQYINELLRTKKVKYMRADENTIPIVDSGPIQLIPIGPCPLIPRFAAQKTITSGKIRDDLNRLSIVLALVVRSKNGNFDALLAADTDASGFKAAMKRLQKKLGEENAPRFDVTKVSHHGSLDSHHGSNVCKHKKEDKQVVAAVSAGPFDVLPDREVLNDFINHGWNVLLTTKRIPDRRKFALELFGRATNNSMASQTYNIKLQWEEGKGLSWSPPEAQVYPDELSNYQTAAV